MKRTAWAQVAAGREIDRLQGAWERGERTGALRVLYRPYEKYPRVVLTIRRGR